jgi:uncharacterized protein YjbJ (UPF0337 family)
MSSVTDKIQGTADKVVGGAKRGIGQATGDKKLEAEGKVQEVRGYAEKAIGDVKSVAKGAANAVADKANRNL